MNSLFKSIQLVLLLFVMALGHSGCTRTPRCRYVLKPIYHIHLEDKKRWVLSTHLLKSASGECPLVVGPLLARLTDENSVSNTISGVTLVWGNSGSETMFHDQKILGSSYGQLVVVNEELHTITYTHINCVDVINSDGTLNEDRLSDALQKIDVPSLGTSPNSQLSTTPK